MEVSCHSDQNILQKMMVNKSSKELSISETGAYNCLRDSREGWLVTNSLNMVWDCWERNWLWLTCEKNHDFSFRTVLVFLSGLVGASVHSEAFRFTHICILGLSLFLLLSKILILFSWASAATFICATSFSISLSASSTGGLKRSIKVQMLWSVEGSSFSVESKW